MYILTFEMDQYLKDFAYKGICVRKSIKSALIRVETMNFNIIPDLPLYIINQKQKKVIMRVRKKRQWQPQ